MKATLGLAALAASAAASASVRSDEFDLEKLGTIESTDEVGRLALYAQYSNAAYCESVTAAAGSALDCPATVCPALAKAGSTLVAILDDTLTDMQGFVAVDPERETILIVYRGSSSIPNWIVDLTFVLESCGDLLSAELFAANPGLGPDDCLVHQGFGATWSRLRDKTLTALALAQKQHPTYSSVVVTGHSLGAAIATLAAIELRARGIVCDLFTYGSPRVGNAVLAEFITTQDAGSPTLSGRGSNGTINNYRVTHIDDPVPRLPPLLTDYRHSSPEFWMDLGSAFSSSSSAADAIDIGIPGALAYEPSDITACDGYDNTACNGSGGLILDILAHIHYFQPMDVCSASIIRSVDADDDALERAKWRLEEVLEMDRNYTASVSKS